MLPSESKRHDRDTDQKLTGRGLVASQVLSDAMGGSSSVAFDQIDKAPEEKVSAMSTVGSVVSHVNCREALQTEPTVVEPNTAIRNTLKRAREREKREERGKSVWLHLDKDENLMLRRYQRRLRRC